MNIVDLNFNINKMDSEHLWSKMIELMDEKLEINNKKFLMNHVFHEYLKTKYSELHSIIVNDVSLKSKNIYENQFHKIIDKIISSIISLPLYKQEVVIDLLLDNISYNENNHLYQINKSISSFIMCGLLKQAFKVKHEAILIHILKNQTDKLMVELMLNTFMNRDFISFNYKLISIKQLDILSIFNFYVEHNLHIKYFKDDKFNVFIHIEQIFLKFHHHIFQTYPSYRSIIIIQKQIKSIYENFESYFKKFSLDKNFYDKFCHIDKNIFLFNKKQHLFIQRNIKKQLFPSVLHLNKIKKEYKKLNPQNPHYVLFNEKNPVIDLLVQENISYFCLKKSLAIDMNLICLWYNLNNTYQEYEKTTFFNTLVHSLFEIEKHKGFGIFQDIKIGDWSLLDNTKYSLVEFSELYCNQENFNKIRTYIFFIIEGFFMSKERKTSHIDLLQDINSHISQKKILSELSFDNQKKKITKL